MAHFGDFGVKTFKCMTIFSIYWQDRLSYPLGKYFDIGDGKSIVKVNAVLFIKNHLNCHKCIFMSQRNRGTNVYL